MNTGPTTTMNTTTTTPDFDALRKRLRALALYGLDDALDPGLGE